MEEDLENLLCAALAGYGIERCGIAACDDDAPGIEHDDRGAPYAVDGDGHEARELLVSITDEGAERFLAWAHVPEKNPVAGIGIDLCSTVDFREDAAGDRFAQLLFTPGEKELIEQMEGPTPKRRALVFSAKEAAFKSTSAPLRRWYDDHDEVLFFEARDFELCAGGISRGTARSGRAAAACERMGIARIEVAFADYRDMVFCVAVALV